MNNHHYPQWVLFNKDLTHVSVFAELKPRERPSVTCPVCKQPVTLKLGAIRSHHFAHQPDSKCVLTNSESALHFNTKYYLLQQFRKTSEIFISQKCSSSYCHEYRKIKWLSNWDSVEVEHYLDRFRPDIAFLKDGMVIGAVEIFVTHRVDMEKVIFYEKKFVRWLEFEPIIEDYSGETAWQSNQPLDYIRLGQPSPPWKCENCIKLDIEREKAWKQQRKKEEYKRNNRTELTEGMMVDFYFSSGKKLRHVFYMHYVMRNGIWCEAFVVAIMGKDRETIAKVKALALDYNLTEGLKLKVYSFITMKQKRTDAITDIVAPWRKWKQGNKFHSSDLYKFPFRYQWNKKKSEWILVEGR